MHAQIISSPPDQTSIFSHFPIFPLLFLCFQTSLAVQPLMWCEFYLHRFCLANLYYYITVVSILMFPKINNKILTVSAIGWFSSKLYSIRIAAVSTWIYRASASGCLLSTQRRDMTFLRLISLTLVCQSFIVHFSPEMTKLC